MFIVRFAFYFSLSFLILSVPLKNERVFDRIQKFASPTTETFFNNTRELSDNIVEQVKKYGSKLFTNIHPENRKSDRVVSKRSAPKRRITEEESSKPEDSYTDQEKRLLEKILKETHY